MKLPGLGLVLLLMLCACEHGKGGGVPPIDGGSGADCGGFVGATCSADEFCDFGRNSCGATDESGICRARPTGCPDFFQPTCGCDGEVHSNPCEANAAGVDTSDIGSCPAPPNQFACGSTFCDLDTQFCQRAGSDIGGEPDSFQCIELPISCEPIANCGCLANEPCGRECSGDSSNGLTVVCFGG
jgi:hypothetical protein